MHRTPRAAIVAAAALALVATSVAPALADDHLNQPGEPTLALPINDSAAGGTYEQDFTRAYAGATPDGTPVIGPTRYPNLYLNTGHGTLGWTMACGSGRVLADLVSGKTPEIETGDLALSRYES